MSPAAAGPMGRILSAARSLVWIGAVLAVWLLGLQTEIPELRGIAQYTLLLALVVACFGRWGRRDPIGLASIVGPALAYAPYQSILSLGAEPDLRAIEALMVDIVGAERAASAAEVRTIRRLPDNGPIGRPLWLASVGWTSRAQLGLMLYALLAGGAAKVVDELASDLYADGDVPAMASRVIKIATIAVAMLLPPIATRRSARILSELLLAVLVGFVAWWLVDPIASLLDIIYGQGWIDASWLGRTGVWPFAVIYAIATMLVVMAAAAILRALRQRGHPSRPWPAGATPS